MELITAFALRRGTYEALVNYGIPGLPSQYWWSPDRRNSLPEQEAKTECEAYYPVPKATPIMAPRTFQKKQETETETEEAQFSPPEECRSLL
jgi:hypothetical protein